MKKNTIDQLAEHFGFAESRIFKKILEHLLTVEEAGWMINLPATPSDLATKLNLSIDETKRGVKDLYMRGLVLVAERRADQPVYMIDSNPGRLMDLTLFGTRFNPNGEEILDLWKEFYNKELAFIPRSAERFSFRIVPVLEKIENKQEIMPCEKVEDILKAATRIVVQDCPCRLRERECDNPLETCLSLNQTAEYMLSRNIGRSIEVEEAIGIVKRAEDLGLIHAMDNTESPTTICNCCSCCCLFLKALTKYSQQNVISKSRYFSQVDPAKCTGCEACMDRCAFGAIDFASGGAFIDTQKCYGCGLCSSTCEYDAITLHIRPQEDINPMNGGEFMKGMNKIPA